MPVFFNAGTGYLALGSIIKYFTIPYVSFQQTRKFAETTVPAANLANRFKNPEHPGFNCVINERYQTSNPKTPLPDAYTSRTLYYHRVMLLLDTYIFQAIRTVSQSLSPKAGPSSTGLLGHHGPTLLSACCSLSIRIITFRCWVRTYLFATLIGLGLAKMVAVVSSWWMMYAIIQWAGKTLFQQHECRANERRRDQPFRIPELARTGGGRYPVWKPALWVQQ